MDLFSKPLKISYCTTCKGRLHHLKQTLPANMKAERDNPNVEFVVLDYGSEDGLGDWIKENFQSDIDSGRLIYARTEAPYFKMAHSKNMAHRLATGDLLCNLDADNFIPKNFSHWLMDKFSSNQNILVSSHPVNLRQHFTYKASLRLGRPDTTGDMGGRIALTRDNFNQLGGYDESFVGWGGEDKNFALRAYELGLKSCRLPKEATLMKPIEHGNQERVSQMTADDRAHTNNLFSRSRIKKFRDSIARVTSHPEPIVNNGNFGCGYVRLNFSDEVIALHPFQAKRPRGSCSVANVAIMQDERDLRADWAESLRAGTPPTPVRATR